MWVCLLASPLLGESTPAHGLCWVVTCAHSSLSPQGWTLATGESACHHWQPESKVTQIKNIPPTECEIGDMEGSGLWVATKRAEFQFLIPCHWGPPGILGLFRFSVNRVPILKVARNPLTEPCNKHPASWMHLGLLLSLPFYQALRTQRWMGFWINYKASCL